jgi:biotin synthase-related radical SAM superfamily protein
MKLMSKIDWFLVRMELTIYEGKEIRIKLKDGCTPVISAPRRLKQVDL